MNGFSKFGFILATLGSSVGLGHIWRFPYMAGEMGGSAFVLLFLVLTLVVGVAMLIGEMLMGNKTQKNTTDAFIELDPSPKKPWRFAGLVLIGGPFILTFYSVVLGWVVYYLFSVSIDLPKDAKEADFIYNTLLGSQIWWQILGFSVVLGLTGLIVSLGVKEGIERLNVVLMPLLFSLLFGKQCIFCLISNTKRLMPMLLLQQWGKCVFHSHLALESSSPTLLQPIKSKIFLKVLYILCYVEFLFLLLLVL